MHNLTVCRCTMTCGTIAAWGSATAGWPSHLALQTALQQIHCWVKQVALPCSLYIMGDDLAWFTTGVMLPQAQGAS